jgi:hypothetical protein
VVAAASTAEAREKAEGDLAAADANREAAGGLGRLV